MLRAPRRRFWSLPVLRRRLGYALLVLYVAALHGLPALHLATHRNDHVHELGGLRWLRAIPAHVHGEAPRREVRAWSTQATTAGPRQHLRAATERDLAAAAPHLALGAAHGYSALVAPPVLLSLAPAAQHHCRALSAVVPLSGELVSRHRARAPPSRV